MEDIFERAFNAAAAQLQIPRAEMKNERAEIRQGLCWISFQTDFQSYECALEPGGSELSGIDSRPDSSGFFMDYKYQSF